MIQECYSFGTEFIVEDAAIAEVRPIYVVRGELSDSNVRESIAILEHR